MQKGVNRAPACAPRTTPRANTVSRQEEAARRMLNLLFTLSVASEPLSTEDIIDDPEIGYTSPGRDSRVKAFNRDRDTLASLGVFIREESGCSTAKNEQRRWEIDRSSTHADVRGLSPYDAEEAVTAIDQVFALHAADPTRWPLQMARTKLCEVARIDPRTQTPRGGQTSADLANLWSAFSRRRPAVFAYRDARGEERTHTVDLYGIFELGRHVYLVGRDHAADDLRTFRTDRVVSAKKSPDSSKPYRIPEEFDIAGFQFLPFDFSRNDPVQAQFRFSTGVGKHEVEFITKGRGRILEHEDGSRDWMVDVRDLDAAARFALELAHAGLTVLAPAELTNRVSQYVEQAVLAHDC